VTPGQDIEGKFAFVELKTEELATQALHLDKVELCGRPINVGRPKGYVDPNTPGLIKPEMFSDHHSAQMDRMCALS
jgi:hypothetical protein